MASWGEDFLKNNGGVSGAFEHPGIAPGITKLKGLAKSLKNIKKPFSLDKVMANVKNDFARPNLFEVSIDQVKTSSQEPFRINCFQAQIPGSNIATTDKDIGFRSVAYQKIYADVILGFYSSGDLRELKFFQDWIDNIVSPVNNHFNYYSNYVGRIKIKQLTRKGNVVGIWTLMDAYPKTVDPIQLDYGTTDTIMTVNVTMTYRNFTAFFPLAKVKEGTGLVQENTYAPSVDTAMNINDPTGGLAEVRANPWKYAGGGHDDTGPSEF